MLGALSRLVLLVLSFVLVALPALPGARAQLRPEIRDRIIAAAVQIAGELTATNDLETKVVPLPVGSGTIVSNDGLILTNWHVVDMREARRQVEQWRAQAAEEGYDLRLTLNEDRYLIFVSDGIHAPRQKYTARVVEKETRLDLAVLRIDGGLDGTSVPANLELAFVPLGDSDAVKIGDPVDVFSYPAIGGDALTFTTGVVSGFNAEIGIGDRAWITTDATLSGGSSGGAAVNSQGQLVGVPTQGSELDCRPGDTNADGRITVDDVGCVPLGGSIGQMRPINLAKPMLAKAGWVETELSRSATEREVARQDVVPTNTPPTSPTNAPIPAPSTTLTPSSATDLTERSGELQSSGNVSTYRGNSARTGEMPGPEPKGPIGQIWQFDVGQNYLSSPTLVDGILYFGARDEQAVTGLVSRQVCKRRGPRRGVGPRPHPAARTARRIYT